MNRTRLRAKGFQAHPLTRVSRQLRAETMPSFYRHSIFILNDIDFAANAFHWFFRKTPREMITSKSNIEMYIKARPFDPHKSALNEETLWLISGFHVILDDRINSVALPIHLLRRNTVDFTTNPAFSLWVDLAFQACRFVYETKGFKGLGAFLVSAVELELIEVPEPLKNFSVVDICKHCAMICDKDAPNDDGKPQFSIT